MWSFLSVLAESTCSPFHACLDIFDTAHAECTRACNRTVRGAACSRQFQEEVEERARRGLQEVGAAQHSSELGSSAAAPMTYRTGNSFMAGTGPATTSSASECSELEGACCAAQETVDELRAEMASTRAAVKLYKEQRQAQQQSAGPL